MCTAAFTWNPEASPSLVLLHNRDEFHARPTEPAAARGGIVYGKDLLGGGTWLALSRTGRLAVVMNFRQGIVTKGRRSRGVLPLSFVEGKDSPRDYLAMVQAHLGDYAPFSLVCGSLAEGFSSLASPDGVVRTIGPGLHSLSNGGVDQGWPKERRLARALASLAGKSFAEEELLCALRDQTQASDAELPRTGVPLEVERQLSSIFVRSDTYGTRAATLVSLDTSGASLFREQSFDPSGTVVDDRRFASS